MRLNNVLRTAAKFELQSSDWILRILKKLKLTKNLLNISKGTNQALLTFFLESLENLPEPADLARQP